MIKSQEIHTLIKSIAKVHLEHNNANGFLKLCAANEMTPLELFAKFISLESVETVGEMGG